MLLPARGRELIVIELKAGYSFIHSFIEESDSIKGNELDFGRWVGWVFLRWSGLRGVVVIPSSICFLDKVGENS